MDQHHHPSGITQGTGQLSPNKTLLPDFIVIGAMKCGTSTLQTQLAVQPGVFMTTPKEPNFFSDDQVYAKGMGWYHALFAQASDNDLKGEASTHYAKLPTHPHTVARLSAALKAPKLIYMIRDPVERAVSHYIHEWSEARMSSDPIAEFARHPELVDYGRYAMQLEPWITAFGRAAILLTSLERMKTDPDGELRRIGAHLGADPSFEWQTDIDAQNVSAQRMRRVPMQGLFLDNPVARFLRRSLIPKALRTKIREARMIKKRPDLPDALREELEAVFLEDRTLLASQFPDHPALSDAYPFAS